MLTSYCAVLPQKYDRCVPSSYSAQVSKHLWWTLLQVIQQDCWTLLIYSLTFVLKILCCSQQIKNQNAQDGDLLVVLHLLRRLDGGAGLRASRSQQRKSLLQARVLPKIETKTFSEKCSGKSTKCSWDAFLSAQHRGSLTKVGSNSVAGFSSLLMWLWVWITIFLLFFFVVSGGALNKKN